MPMIADQRAHRVDVAERAGRRAVVPRRRSRSDVATGASVAVLSTYPPTQCGLATFTAALVAHLDGPQHFDANAVSVSVVRVLDGLAAPTVDGPADGAEVSAYLVNGSRTSARNVATHLNQFDVVLLQHEYGIYGGVEGADVLALVAQVTTPLVVVLHTVLETPTAVQRIILEQLLDTAHTVVTMTATARDRLIAGYAANPARVIVIPHGAVDHAVGPPVDGRPLGTDAPAGPLALTGEPGRRPVVLTWGLLGPGKGIEWAIDALAGLRDLRPRYLVMGRTHPKVLARDGEAYRESLVARAAAAGVADLLELDDTYRDVAEIAALVASADVVLLPYDSREQVTSGVLTEAVAAGCPVVSTAFPHAVELLTDGPGLVVPQRDGPAIETALRRVLAEPGLRAEFARRAVRVAPELLWSAVAARYRELFAAVIASSPAAPVAAAATNA